MEEYTALSTFYSNVFYINQNNIPMIQKIPDTQKIYSIFPDKSTDRFIISYLLYSYTNCRSNITNVDNYMFKNEYAIQRKKVRVMNDNNNEEDIADLNKRELKEIYRTYGLLVSGIKEELIAKIVPYLKGLSSIVNAEDHLQYETDVPSAI